MMEKKIQNIFCNWRRDITREKIYPSTLKRNDNSVVTSDPEILNECVKFYRELYSSKLGNVSQSKLDELTDEFFPADKEIRISLEQSESCEGPLTEECLVALKAMESGKSPGSDGFPIEFYKVFWYDISTILLEAITCSYEKRKLSITQRSGIISLIPKDKLPYSLENWRPIPLLNCDYKILAKVIDNRYC